MTSGHNLTYSHSGVFMVLLDRKHREFEQREEDILDVALELFSQPKWDSVTIAQIAKAAGIGKGTVYKHFVSKDELLFRLFLRFEKGLLDKFRLESFDDKNPLFCFQKIIDIAFRYHLDNRHYRYIVEYCNLIDFKERADESWYSSFYELDRAFDDWADPLFISGIEQGVFANRPIEEIKIGLHACFDGAINMLWAGKDWCQQGDEESIIRSATAFMISAMIGQK